MDKLQLAITAAAESGTILLENYGKIFQQTQKESLRDVATDIDLLCEESIIKTISSKYPDETLLTEESGLFERNKDSMWIIDALDGTVNYIHNIPIFCVSISYWEGLEPILGVVFNPITQELFYAEKGVGSFLNQKRLLFNETPVDQSLCAMAFSGKAQSKKNRVREFEMFGNINDISQGCLRTGSAAMNLCYLAQSKLGFCFGKSNKLWDIAAGIVIASEAGANVNFSSPVGDNFLVDYIAGSENAYNEFSSLVDISYLKILG